MCMMTESEVLWRIEESCSLCQISQYQCDGGNCNASYVTLHEPDCGVQTGTTQLQLVWGLLTLAKLIA